MMNCNSSKVIIDAHNCHIYEVFCKCWSHASEKYQTQNSHINASILIWHKDHGPAFQLFLYRQIPAYQRDVLQMKMTSNHFLWDKIPSLYVFLVLFVFWLKIKQESCHEFLLFLANLWSLDSTLKNAGAMSLCPPEKNIFTKIGTHDQGSPHRDIGLKIPHFYTKTASGLSWVSNDR